MINLFYNPSFFRNVSDSFNKRNPIFERIIDLILFCVLIAASLKLTYAVDAFIDIGLDDESLYLYNGIKLIKEAQWAPLYSLWYYLLSLLQKDAIALYYLNFKVLICATTAVLYIYLRRITVAPFVALAAAFLYLISPAPYQWPYCSHFALLVLLAFLTFSTFAKSEESYYSLLGLGFILASFARPEFFISFILICLALLFYILRNIKSVSFRPPLHLPVICYFLIAVSALLYYFGCPLSGNRSWIAFGMRYSHNFSTWNHFVINPWTHWVQITGLVFGDANTVMSAAMNNSKEFFRHILYNANWYARNIIHMPLPRFESFLSSISVKLVKSAVVLLIAGMACFIVKKIFEKKIMLDPKITKRLLSIILVISLPTVVSALIVYPTYHYLIIQVVMIMVLFAYLASCAIANRSQASLVSVFASLFLGILIFCFTPNMAYGWNIARLAAPINKKIVQTQPTLATIRFIRSLNISKKVNMLEAEGGLFMYLSDNYRRIFQFDKNEPFNSFIEKNGVNMIVLDDALRNDTRFSTDKEFSAFLDRPDSLGFYEMKIPGTERRLLIKKVLKESNDEPESSDYNSQL